MNNFDENCSGFFLKLFIDKHGYFRIYHRLVMLWDFIIQSFFCLIGADPAKLEYIGETICAKSEVKI